MNLYILLFIFGINLIYIMLNTIRTLLAMRGYRSIAPFIAMIEVTIYTIGLSVVMKYLDTPIYLVVYALGYGIGIYLGILLEDKIALGHAVIQIFTQSTDNHLAQSLRQQGYGVTVQTGYGRDGDRLIMTVLTPRSREQQVCRTIEAIDPKVFYISYDAKYIHGGFWTKRLWPSLPHPRKPMRKKSKRQGEDESKDKGD
ncbi:DUF2179 domain-containing protein [Aerococcus urinae]|uniref:DUF2179 domain-containing protein n=1 Tax=Aerococcus urinae TaxID=1376 RepID=UPI0018E1799D|nr:DUF2179 domain-containing protein [Aerococcus urinae]